MSLPKTAPPARTGVADDLVNPAVAAQADDYRRDFQGAQPFKHIVIEGFFDPAFAKALVEDFPTFDPRRAKNEFGEIGSKAVNERIDSISANYAVLSRYLKTDSFLQLISQLTGIADLVPDPKLYGGGTHESQHGQELDAHIDFNYDPATRLHRRLNLLVYLNNEWREEWGGSIELHSNPRDPDANRVTAFTPDLNRALIFETNEYSWHGFPKINLPDEKRHLSRKSLSIYLYTRDRPSEEIVPEHGTFYVQRPLPGHIRPGHVMTEADVTEVRNLLTRRDGWIAHYQAMELKVSRRIADLDDRLKDQGGLKKVFIRSMKYRLSRLVGLGRK